MNILELSEIYYKEERNKIKHFGSNNKKKTKEFSYRNSFWNVNGAYLVNFNIFE